MKKLLIATGVLLGSCGTEPTDMEVYTLYRTPLAGSGLVHVATFDAKHGGRYNRENCDIIAELMQSQPAVQVAYVCRAGREIP